MERRLLDDVRRASGFMAKFLASSEKGFLCHLQYHAEQLGINYVMK